MKVLPPRAHVTPRSRKPHAASSNCSAKAEHKRYRHNATAYSAGAPKAESAPSIDAVRRARVDIYYHFVQNEDFPSMRQAQRARAVVVVVVVVGRQV